jgi:hypothetical protein
LFFREIIVARVGLAHPRTRFKESVALLNVTCLGCLFEIHPLLFFFILTYWLCGEAVFPECGVEIPDLPILVL